MKIEFVEFSNFRRLHSVRVDFAQKQTLLVGANNSGKTSAMVALRLFLKEKGGFSAKDVTASNWIKIEKFAETWSTDEDSEAPNPEQLNELLPAIDVWISVEDNELHHVAHLIPSLDWTGGRLGVRIRLEAKSFNDLLKQFLQLRSNATTRVETYKSRIETSPTGFSLWPKSFKDYLDRKFTSVLKLQTYLLDPSKVVSPDADHRAQPQRLPTMPEPLNREPFASLIHLREIRAQRGFADASESRQHASYEGIGKQSTAKNQKLSTQLQAYYRHHLDPDKAPTDEDVSALGAFHEAQSTFDERLEIAFKSAKDELEQLGYPGVSNPKLSISTKIRPTDGLNHPSAVQYEIGGADEAIRLPEDYSGLGFQNLISMVFQLMRFRDDWMRVGKRASSTATDDGAIIEPLQLILVEEPEAHLHAQVQQVFIRKAYEVLRNHPDLGKKLGFHSQLIVSTHSSHVVHELDFSSLRYFKRQPAGEENVPISVVANLSDLFGEDTETTRFVRRYLKTTHCDLFFADGVILVEGVAERILVPHFIRHHFPDLTHRYISLLELGGSHAHRLRPLIELLSIPTLIISDLDAVDPSNNKKAVRPQRGQEYITSNSVLKSWLPKQMKIDDLLSQEDLVPTVDGGGYGVVGVVYQRAHQVDPKKNSTLESPIPSTFEDALTLANLSLIENISGKAMTKAFADIVRENTNVEEVAKKLYDHLRKSPEKAAFALDLLMSEDFGKLVPPPYVAGGLCWLQEQLETSANIV